VEESTASRVAADTGGSTANGTKIQEYQCNGTSAQKWKLVPVS
jgi:hypothetical protein